MGAWCWAFWVGGAAAGLIGLWVLWCAMFADRARGRRRCSKCWYDMAGVPGLKCPECGREAKRERQLGRTRRRWRLALGACVLLGIAVGLGSTPRVVEKGWGAAPLWVLVLLHACIDVPEAELELQERTFASEIRWWPDRVAMRWRARRLLNDPDAVAMTTRWRSLTKLDLAIRTYAAIGNTGAGDVDRLLAVVAEQGAHTKSLGLRRALLTMATDPVPIDAVIERIACDPSPEIREMVASIIEESGSARWTALLGTLLNDPAARVRRSAIGVLPSVYLRAGGVPPGLSELASSDKHPDSAELFYQLGTMGGLALPTLEEVLRGGTAGARALAAKTLWRMESAARPVLGVILEHSQHDPSADVRRECVLALGMCGRVEDNVDAVIGEIATSDVDELVRVAAFDAMAWEIVKVRYIGYAEQGLSDRSVLVRRSASKVLLLVGEGTPETMRALRVATQDEDAAVARNARAALEVLESRQERDSEP